MFGRSIRHAGGHRDAGAAHPEAFRCLWGDLKRADRYDFRLLKEDLEDIGIDMAATIHTKRGLLARVSLQ